MSKLQNQTHENKEINEQKSKKMTQKANLKESSQVNEQKQKISDKSSDTNKQQNGEKNCTQKAQQCQKCEQSCRNEQKRQRDWQKEAQTFFEKKRFQFCDGSIVFTIEPEYHIDKIIGSGIYGIVASGKNLLTNQSVAIKKISKLFNNFGDTKRVLRQIKVLGIFCSQNLEFLNHKNIISLQNIMRIDNPKAFNEIYLCMEYMQFDLRRLIQSQTKITEQMIKYIMYQLLAAINFMHSADILHRDLKPQNILMNKKCELKLADMNLARKQIFTGAITDYVASRPYRAPQILIGSTVYTKSVDIWSIGCIFAELLGKTIIFQGKDFIDQLKRLVAILGKPKIQYFPHMDKTSMQSLAKLIAQIPDKQKVEWKYLMPDMSDTAADLLDHMLTYDSEARYTAQDCLNHPYLEQYKKAPRVKCKQVFDFSFDTIQLKEDSLRKAIIEAVDQFHDKIYRNNGQVKQNSEEDKIKKKIKENSC